MSSVADWFRRTFGSRRPANGRWVTDEWQEETPGAEHVHDMVETGARGFTDGVTQTIRHRARCSRCPRIIYKDWVEDV